MYGIKELEIFNFTVFFLINALKTQNKKYLEHCIHQLTMMLSERCVLDIFISAIIKLSHQSPNTSNWIQNANDLKNFALILEVKNFDVRETIVKSNEDNEQIFNSNVGMVIHTLRMRNQPLLISYEKVLTSIFSNDYAKQAFIAALFELASTQSLTFCWIVSNLSQLDFYQEIFKIVNLDIARRLIEQGFIFGEDFSVNSQGQIIINVRAKNRFIENVLDQEDRILFQQILQAA